MPNKETTKKEVHVKPTTTKIITTVEKVSTPVVKQVRIRTKKVPAEVAELPKLRIRIRAYEHKILDASLKQIMDTAARYDAEFFGPVPLPTEIKKYTVNRSSFVHKNAREQFEMRVHKRLVDIINPNPKVIDALTNLSLPSGVNIEVKMM
jgi:small subunit ribosomal protein S10